MTHTPKTPTATVVVPAFNVEATIADTLNALFAQTYESMEILIIDDGSTDGTPDIARAACIDPRVRMIRQANRGLAGARNTGIAHARGAFIGFCDSDDLWAPDKLARHVAHLQARPEVGLSFSGSVLIDEQGRPTGQRQSPRLTDVTPADVFKRNPVGNGSAPVLRRAALRDIAYRPDFETRRDWFFDETFRQSEDIECWLRLALTTDWQIEGIPGHLTRYRVNAAGLSANTARQLASWERMVTKLAPLAPDFISREAPAARAYQLRYLARRAVSDLDGRTALDLARQARACSPVPMREEPAKTLTTYVAAWVLATFGAAPVTFLRQAVRRLGAPKPNRTWRTK